MTEESIKEELSYNYLGLLASRAGFLCGPPPKDYGIDLQLRKVGVSLENGRRRYLDMGQIVQLQVKSTSESAIINLEGLLKFDLEAKTFNDLVRRRNAGGIPMYLVIFVLPDDGTKWLTIYRKGLITRKTAYWYRPELGVELTPNANTKRIEFNPEQVVNMDVIREWFMEHYE